MSRLKELASGEAGDLVPPLNKHLQPAKVFNTRLDSFSSLSSIYSADGGQADYRISGSVMLGIWHKNNTLFVRLVQAKGLAGAQAGGLSDPYVKTYILPDSSKRTKRKTTIQRRTNDPTYNEILKTQLPQSDINISTLWVSIWNWDRFGRNLFLGEVQFKLSSIDLTTSTDRWYKLRERKFEPESEDNRGTIEFSIMYSPYNNTAKGSLFIKVKEAKGLPIMNSKGLADSSVRIFLLPKRTPYTKKKTHCVKNTLDPIWDKQFEYKYVSLEELETSRVLELTVWDFDRRGCNDFMGCVRLGPNPDETNNVHKDWMDSTDSEAEFWASMLASPKEWVSVSLPLRSSIASRFAEPPDFQDESDYSLEPSEGEEDEESDEDDDSNYGSKLSLYSECETRGNYPITGSLQVKLEHKKSSLRVHVISAKDLAAADSNGFSDPYVKMYLLPDKSKHSKRKTDVKMKTLKPVYNEIMQYEVESAKLSSRTLWFSVWDWDRFGKNEFLGEVKVPLTESNINGPASFYDLSDSMEVGTSSKAAPYVGKLTMALKFEELGSRMGEMYGKLHIQIRNAKQLANMDTDGYTDGFVKMFLLPSKSSKMQRKTKVIKDDLNPTWNERFVYDKVTLEQLSMSHALEVTVWDHDLISSNDFVGGLRIGPAPKLGQTKEWMDSTSEEASQWEEMLSCPNEWVERCHVLRPSMNYRDISVSETKPVFQQQDTTRNVSTVSVDDKEKKFSSQSPAALGVPSPKLSVHKDSLSSDISDEEAAQYLHRGSMVITKGTPSPKIRSKRKNPPTSPPQPVNGQESEVRSEPSLSSASESSLQNEAFRELNQVAANSTASLGSSSSIQTGDPSNSTQLATGVVQESGSEDQTDSDSLDVQEDAVGQLVLLIKFEVTSKKSRTKGNLHVLIKEAQQLKCKTKDGIFAKCRMLPQRAFSHAKKTKVIKNIANPSWDQEYTFNKHFLDEIATDKVLEVTLWDYHNGSQRIFVGGLRLGPDPKSSSRKFMWMDSIKSESDHWQAVFAKPGEWIEVRHNLRATMNC